VVSAFGRNELERCETDTTSMRRLLVIASVSASLALAACGDDGDEESPAAGSEPEPATTNTAKPKADDGGGEDSAPAQKPGTEIRISGSQFGEMLFNADEQAIYLFDKEESARSECYGECADAWPPVLTEGDPEAGAGADPKLLGTTERDDGATQVTYNGHPLYYYAHEGPGEVLCHGVSEFGGLWLVVAPNGEAVS
jgi:predicted lipoprotein with Yx(FWY)xxD motif